MEMEQIKTFEDACQKLGIEPKLPEVTALPEKHQRAILANYQLMIIAEALNDGWQPDWNNDDEYKYYPWFDMEDQDPAGSGLSFHGYGHAGSITHVGSRLCFKTRDLARYAGWQFEALYADYMVIK